MKEAPVCQDMTQEPYLMENSLKILKNSIEGDFVPKGSVERSINVADEIQGFVEKSQSQKFDIKNLIPVLEAASKVQADVEQVVAKVEQHDFDDADWSEYEIKPEDFQGIKQDLEEMKPEDIEGIKEEIEGIDWSDYKPEDYDKYEDDAKYEYEVQTLKSPEEYYVPDPEKPDEEIEPDYLVPELENEIGKYEKAKMQENDE